MKQSHIVIHLPSLFLVRDFLYTPVWDEMARRGDARFTLLCNDPSSPKVINERHVPHISGARLWGPCAAFGRAVGKRGAIWRVAGKWVRFYQRIDMAYLDPSLVYRFAAVNDLSVYHVRKRRSHAEQERHRVFPEYRQGERVRFPFPRSSAMLKALYRLRHGRINPGAWSYRSLVSDLKPDLFVFSRLHYEWTPCLARALKQAGVPMVGNVGSWDHLTTKCPTPAGMSRYIVASRRMAVELTELHGIERRKVTQVGKVQMDIYKGSDAVIPRERFMESLGFSPDSKLVTFGTNATGLKEHEVSIARHLAEAFRAGRYGKASLLIRAHPQDKDWERDFNSLNCPPTVRCIKAAGFVSMAGRSAEDASADLVQLANLMRHSDVVIQSRGSLALDAIAFDTPVISLAFDGDLDRLPQDSFLHEYEYDHYAPIVKAEGTWMVGSYDALDRAIKNYLSDPGKHSEGRTRIRAEQIEPFDGSAGRRLVDSLVDWAKLPKQELLADADWDYAGLGDTHWARKQTCDVSSFITR